MPTTNTRKYPYPERVNKATIPSHLQAFLDPIDADMTTALANAQSAVAMASEAKTITDGLNGNTAERIDELAQQMEQIQAEQDEINQDNIETRAEIDGLGKLVDEKTFKTLVSTAFGVVAVGSNFRGVRIVSESDLTGLLNVRGTPLAGDPRLMNQLVSPVDSPKQVGANFRGSAIGSGSSSSSSVAPKVSPVDKWVHYGDSLTDWGTPEALATLTGYTHINAGIASDLSSQIATRAGGWEYSVKVSGETIPASGSVELIAHRPVALPQGTTRTHDVSIAGVNGTISKASMTAPILFTRATSGSAVSVPGWTKVTLDPLTPTPKQTEGNVKGYSLIIGMGRNDLLQFQNGGNIESVLMNIRKTIEANSAQVKSVLIWDIPPWSFETFGTGSRTRLDEWNAAIKSAFPQYTVSIADKLRTDEAFTIAGVTKTAQDATDISNGLTPTSFRKDTAGHFNDAGNKVWAYYMLQEMKKRGYYIG